MTPSINKGVHLKTAFFMDVIVDMLLLLAVEEEFEEDDQPAIIMKLAAPKSIQPYPPTSVLQYRLGKIGKSTAKMAMAV